MDGAIRLLLLADACALRDIVDKGGDRCQKLVRAPLFTEHLLALRQSTATQSGLEHS
jgi:hypothetical protein